MRRAEALCAPIVFAAKWLRSKRTVLGGEVRSKLRMLRKGFIAIVLGALAKQQVQEEQVRYTSRAYFEWSFAIVLILMSFEVLRGPISFGTSVLRASEWLLRVI